MALGRIPLISIWQKMVYILYSHKSEVQQRDWVRTVGLVGCQTSVGGGTKNSRRVHLFTDKIDVSILFSWLFWQLDDGAGKKSKLCLWNHPGNDITGMVGRSEKVVTTSEKLLGGEVYHYHTKLMMKEAFTGGQHVWHQDYG